METVLFEYGIPCGCAFLACVGFTVMFNIHGVGKLFAGVGGAMGWLIYLLAGSTIFGAFLAAFAVGIFAEIMSRVRLCPVTGYVLVALLPLVPGGGIYYAMRFCVEGNTAGFLDRLLHTFGMAAALAVGANLASAASKTALHCVRLCRTSVPFRFLRRYSRGSRLPLEQPPPPRGTKDGGRRTRDGRRRTRDGKRRTRDGGRKMAGRGCYPGPLE